MYIFYFKNFNVIIKKCQASAPLQGFDNALSPIEFKSLVIKVVIAYFVKSPVTYESVIFVKLAVRLTSIPFLLCKWISRAANTYTFFMIKGFTLKVIISFASEFKIFEASTFFCDFLYISANSNFFWLLLNNKVDR